MTQLYKSNPFQQAHSNYQENTKKVKFSFKKNSSFNHQLGLNEDTIKQPAKVINSKSGIRTGQRFSSQYIPLGSIVDNSILRKHELVRLHFHHIYLHSENLSSLKKIVFKHNKTNKQIKFYLPTFIRFSLIKLHSEDLKNITHIENKNNMIIYINVYSRGLPKMLIEKLTKKQNKSTDEENPGLYFRANRQLYEAKYYTSYNDYLIFMFNAFSENTVEFEIIKNVFFAPFQQAQLILNLRINKKIFKLENSKTIKISKNFSPTNTPSKQELQTFSEQQNKTIFLQFDKIVLEFKLQKPKSITDSFKFHKSIQFGNYGIMTNEVHVNVGTYEIPFQKKQFQDQVSQLNDDSESQVHLAQLEDISSLRLSIGLYKHPMTELCTFFIPLMLAGGLTLLLFNMCDHDLSNQLQVLAIILVAYGAFIPQFRDRISMSRTVIFIDFYILYNMIPAVLCAIQSITESRDNQSYNSYHVISVIMYYVSALILVEIYSVYVYVQIRYFRKYFKNMINNFDTQIFDKPRFEQDLTQSLSWFATSPDERVYFCDLQDEENRRSPTKSGFRHNTLYTSNIHYVQNQNESDDQLPPMRLQLKMSESTNRKMRQVVHEADDEQRRQQHHEDLYRTKAIENQRHVHSFEKFVTIKKLFCMILLLFVILGVTLWSSWDYIYQIYTFQDINRNCIPDQKEAEITKAQQILHRLKNSQNYLEDKQTEKLDREMLDLNLNNQFSYKHKQENKHNEKYSKNAQPQVNTLGVKKLRHHINLFPQKG